MNKMLCGKTIYCCVKNIIPSIDSIPVLADYFGSENLCNYNEDDICIILELYDKKYRKGLKIGWFRL